MRLASLETSSPLGSVALFEDGALVAEDVRLTGRGHGEVLLPMLDALFSRVGWRADQVARWGVGIGPGSFTGTRVALSVAKGIVIATGAELVGVTSLDALAHGLEGDAFVASLAAAGHGELFVQTRRAGRLVLAPTHIRSEDVPSVLAALAQPLAGEGPERLLVCGAPAGDLAWGALGVATCVSPPHDLPRASAVGFLAHVRPATDAERLEPAYVRPPEITAPKPKTRPG